jgi:hypothetical protein
LNNRDEIDVIQGIDNEMKFDLVNQQWDGSGVMDQWINGQMM